MEINKKDIETLYWEKNESVVQIAKILGCGSSTIYNKMDKFNIKRKSVNECQNPIYINKNELIYYYKEDYSMNDIAKIYDVSPETIRRLFIKYDIPRKNKTYKCQGWNKDKEMSLGLRKNLSEKRKEKFRRGLLVHWNKGGKRSIDTKNKISNTLLEKNNNRLVISYYGSGWKKQRIRCLERDGYVCQQCGNTNNLEVHHWEPYRFSFNNNLDNLITLCWDCHKDVHRFYINEGFIKDAEKEIYGI